MYNGLTFPGIILHEYAHEKACKAVGLEVYTARYFELWPPEGQPAGFVLHEETDNYWNSFVISVAPMAVNSIFAIALGVIAGVLGGVLSWIFLWGSFSFGLHALPSNRDLMNAFEQLDLNKNPVAVLTMPVVLVLLVADYLRYFWVALIYAIILTSIGWELGMALLLFAV